VGNKPKTTYMYYEYHLEDGTIRNSNIPNLSSFDDCEDIDYCPCCGHGQSYTYCVKVHYCMIRQGELVKDIESGEEFYMDWD
jgi:hypothetical protein